jgi:predicted lipase
MQLDMKDTPAAICHNAEFLAAASEFAYSDESQGREEFKNHLGLDARLLSVGNTQVFVATDANHVVVAFRGTESPTSLDGFKDCLLSDANNFLIIPEGRIGTDFAAAGVGARFHRGFMQALADIWDPLFAAVDGEIKKQERPLWLTGHSLGGALALLAGWRFVQQFISVHRIYTFGAPMVGNTTAVQAFDKEFQNKIFRFVHEPDLVPHLPTISLLANAYGHCLQEMLLSSAAVAAAAETVSSAAGLLQKLAASTKEGLLDGQLIDKMWAHVTQRLGAHGIAMYRTRLTEKIKELG